MMWITVHLVFAALPLVLTAALRKRKRHFWAGEGDVMARSIKARKLCAQVMLFLLLMYHYVYTNGHPGGFGVLFSTGACAALFSSRRTNRWLRGLSGRPRAFAALALAAVVIGFVPGLYTVAVTAAYLLLAALFYPSARAVSECDGKDKESGRAEHPATSAESYHDDHHAELPHEANNGNPICPCTFYNDKHQKKNRNEKWK